MQVPPTSPWTCDVCGGEVTQRDDDTEQAVRERLATYLLQTIPVVKWFEEQGLLATVDGVGDRDEITEELISLVTNRLF